MCALLAIRAQRHNQSWDIFFACLLWLEIRVVPRWAVWLSFILLSMPCLAYMWACAHIDNKVLSL